MDNLLFYAFLAAVGGLVWLHLNRRNTEALNALKRHSYGFRGLALVEKALLLAAGLMGSLFAYGIFAPIHPLLGYLVAAMVIAFNFAEGFLIRLSLAAWRYDFKAISMLSAVGVLIVMGYSLTAGSSVIETYLSKNQDLQLAAQYEIKASRDAIETAKTGILKAQMEAREKDPYSYLNDPSIAQAQINASTISAQENQRIAQVLKEKTPEFKAAFGMTRDAVAFMVALALEFSILGIVLFSEIFNKPTPLPALVKFANKQLDWNVNQNQLNNLSIEKSPAPDVVALPHNPSQVSFAGTVPSAQPRVETVPIHPVLSPQLPRAQGTQGVSALHDANLATPTRQDELFDLWVSKLKSGELKPSTEATRLFISQQKLATGIKLIAGLADSWLERAENIGVLKLTGLGEGKPKYCLAGENSQRFSLRKGEGA